MKRVCVCGGGGGGGGGGVGEGWIERGGEGLQISNFVCFLVIFKWHRGNGTVNILTIACCCN